MPSHVYIYIHICIYVYVSCTVLCMYRNIYIHNGVYCIVYIYITYVYRYLHRLAHCPFSAVASKGHVHAGPVCPHPVPAVVKIVKIS